jgi:hypothetical protein
MSKVFSGGGVYVGMTENKNPPRWRVRIYPADTRYCNFDELLKVLRPVDGRAEFVERAEVFRKRVLEASAGWLAAYGDFVDRLYVLPMGKVVAGSALKEYVIRRFCLDVTRDWAAPADKRSEKYFRSWQIYCEVLLEKAVVWRVGTTPERALAFDAKTVRRLVYPLFPLSVKEVYLKKTRGLSAGREVAQVICQLMNKYKAYYRGGKEMGANLTEWTNYCQVLNASQKP